MIRERTPAVTLALLILFLAAHLALLPKTLEDLDSVNFALGVRDFDVARHQPHPPGYPVYIGLAKVSTSVLRAAGIDAAAPRGLAIWSALAGTAAIPALLVLFRRFEGREQLAWWSVLVVAASPLYWFTALRPLSDMLGFAAAMWALALLSASSGRRLFAGALLAGVAVGIRSQTAVLTLPMIAIVLVARRSVALALGAAGAFIAGVLAWGIPLIAASGGWGGYLQALGAQAGEDFSGVRMLWTHHSARDAAHAVMNTFIWPWDWWLGVAVCLLALVGAVRIGWRAPRALASALLVFGPYAVFHLLFQETETTRYALPLLPILAYAAMAAVEGLPARALPAAAVGIAALASMQTIPASLHYAREGAPVFRAFDDMAATAHGGDRVDTVAFHASARRAAQWAAPILPARVASAPHGYEWLALVALWRADPAALVWFAADPRRTDLALLDSRKRDLARAYGWGFIEPPFVGGARPAGIEWYHMGPPNWMLDRGWSVTAEVAGVSARDHDGPPAKPAVAWIKRAPLETTVLLGGRHLGAGTAPVRLTWNGAPLEPFDAAAGFFLRVLTLPAGAGAGAAGYLPLEVASPGHVSLEQFDAQPPGVPMFGYDTGWQEPEYNATEGRSWRWASEKALLWIRPVGRPVTVRLAGEDPRRYYDAPPHVRVTINGQEVSAFDPAGDFEQTVTLPAELLAAANGRVTLESSRFFVSGRGGDQRHLALRIYRVAVE